MYIQLEFIIFAVDYIICNVKNIAYQNIWIGCNVKSVLEIKHIQSESEEYLETCVVLSFENFNSLQKMFVAIKPFTVYVHCQG